MFNILRKVFGKSEVDAFAYSMEKAGDGIKSRKSYSGDHGSSLLVEWNASGEASARKTGGIAGMDAPGDEWGRATRLDLTAQEVEEIRASLK